MPASLPIDPLIPDILAALAEAGAAILLAPPGAGKTTRVPPALLGASWLDPRAGRVLVLQPRRVAARAAAARVAAEQGWNVGQEVGYQVRFDNRIGTTTRLAFLTEGILARRLESDPTLDGVGCVILDEFHERSIHTDLALAMLREIRAALRPELRLLVMSATLEAGPVADYLGGAPVLESPGRIHPVAIEWLPRPLTVPPEQAAADAARSLLAQAGPSMDPLDAADPGHLLVFLPGMGEIRRAEAMLANIPADLHLLHGSVPAQAQDRALRPSPRRKLILATNIAETSLTIDGVRTVIDTGLARVPVSDPRLGIDRLDLRRISRASATQRAGRAGRTAPGRCLRLWTAAEDAALAERETPEVARIDLAPALLALYAYGVSNPARFQWLEPPRPDALALAQRLLFMLGAVDAGGRLTPLGRQLAALPLHPRLGRLLLAGADAGLPREAAALAALLSEQAALATPARQRRRPAGWEGDSDLLDLLDRLENGELEPQIAEPVRRTQRELLAQLQRRGHTPAPRPAGPAARDALLRLALLAWPDRVTLRRPGDPARGLMVGGRGIILEPASVVRRAPLFISIDPREQPGGAAEARVAIASAIEPHWLLESFPHLVERRVDCRFDPARGRVVASRRLLFAGLIVREDLADLAQADPAAIQGALFDHLRSDDAIWREPATERLLARLDFLRRWMPELNLPELDPAEREQILREACAGRHAVAPVAEALTTAIRHRLDPRQRRALDQHAPESLTLPHGRPARLTYAMGAQPILAARIQALFGLTQTPRLAAGRAPLVIHLLAPNGRPVQVTSDLAGFWANTYAQVRRDLRARYPRHAWPENPIA